MEEPTQQDISIIDKDESTEKSCHIVNGFVLEDSKVPFPNGKLSFVPENYGKQPSAPVGSLPQQSTLTHTPRNRGRSSAPVGKLVCEFCAMVGDGEYFLAPSRRFCSLTCCKRYSAEKRYYPYGRNEEGIAQSIKEGLLNVNRNSGGSRGLRGTSIKRERRKLTTRSTEESGGRGRKRSKRGGRISISPLGLGRTATEKSSSLLSTTYTHPLGTALPQWSVEDVGDFLTFLGFEAYVDRFVEHEIDGKALSLIKDHHLLMMLKLRLGPTLKICEQVNAILNIEHFATMETVSEETSPFQ